MLINYGVEWQAAWDTHVQNWHPGDDKLVVAEYVRAEVLNEDLITPIRTLEEQIIDPYHSIEFKCAANVSNDLPYLFAPVKSPYFKRKWDRIRDMDNHPGDKNTIPCIIMSRYDIGVDEYESVEEATSKPKNAFLYTVALTIEKFFEGIFFSELYEITHVPREAISFANLPYSDDIFLKKSFRHEMKLPDDVFPKAWMNLI